MFLFEIDCFHSQWTRNISIASLTRQAGHARPSVTGFKFTLAFSGGFKFLARCLNCQWPFLSCSREYKSYHATVISFSALRAPMCLRKSKSGMQRTILSRGNWTSLRYYVCGLFILYNTSLLLSICTSHWYPYGRSSNNITCCTMLCLLKLLTRKIVTSLLKSS